MATTRTGRVAAPETTVVAETSAAATVARPRVLPGDEIPPGTAVSLPGDERPGVGVLPGDEPPLSPAWVDPVDPRDAPIAHLLQAPPTTGLDSNQEFVFVVPPANGRSEEWFPDGRWFLVRSPIYRRQVGDNANQADAGTRLRLPDDERTADDIRNRYLIPED